MGAFLSLDFVKTGVVELFILFIGFFKGVLLPNQQGACFFLPKIIDQIKELERQKVMHGQHFPGSDSSFIDSERCHWMKKIHKDRPIGKIIWPGTHYSATNKIGIPFITRPFGQRQTLSIFDQLLNGVRALDIRVQQKRLVCNGSMSCNTTLDDIIKDIKRFLKDAKFEIILLHIQTERGFGDPDSKFEDYLEEQFGKLLIPQDDGVFSKSISQLLPGRIICLWKPIIYAHKRIKQGKRIWSGNYLKCDEIDTQMPLTRFDGNVNNLRNRSLASKTTKNNFFFYKVENTLNPKTSTLLESLLIWPKHAKVVSRRINGFTRPFLAKCHNAGILHRLQICSVDFVDDDFVSACIQLNYQAISIKTNEDTTVTLEKVISRADTVDVYEDAQEMFKHIFELTEDTPVTLEEGVNSQIDIVDKHEVPEEMPKPNSELTEEDTTVTLNEEGTGIDNTVVIWVKESWEWIPPKRLQITHIKDDKRWRWRNEWTVHLLRTNSLNVSGNYKVDSFQLGLTYEVLISVEVLVSAFGWESHIHLRLILPDGTIQPNQVMLDMTPTRSRLQYISVGNFIMSQHTRGDIKFSLEQLDDSTPKGGIVIHGVLIMPVYIDMVIPRNLSIKSHHDPACWQWYTRHFGPAKGDIERAEMKEVKDFSVSGVFETGKLSFGCTYKVAFLILLRNICGWETPTTLTLLLPNGSSQQRSASFNEMSQDGILTVYVGEFKMSSELVGQLKFSMENDDSNQKSGLSIYMAFIVQQH